MIVEANIFNCENRVLQYWRNLFVFEWDSFLERKLTDHCFAIVSINSRHNARAISRKCSDFICRARIVQFVGGDDAGQPAGCERQQQNSW